MAGARAPTSLCGCTVPVPSSFSLSLSRARALSPSLLLRSTPPPACTGSSSLRLDAGRATRRPASRSLYLSPLSLSPSCARARARALPPSLLLPFSPSPLLSLPPTTCAKFECKSPIWQARGWPLDSWPSVTLRGWLDRSASSRESGYAPPLLSLSLSPSRWSWYTSNPKPSPQGQKPPFNPSSYRGTSLGAWVCETLCPKQGASGASLA